MPRIIVEEQQGSRDPFKKGSKKTVGTSGKDAKKEAKEGNTMTEVEVTNEVVENVEQTVSKPTSIAELYAEMEREIVARGEVGTNTGVTQRIRDTVEGIFNGTQKEKLLLSAVVHIVQQQEGRTKLYNLVRSIATSKSPQAKYALETIDGRTYIVRK